MRKIDHIGIAVEELEGPVRFLTEHLGLHVKEFKELPDRGLKIAFFEVGEVLVELLAPLGPDSQISKFLANKGQGIHHIALTSRDLETDMTSLCDAGVRMATPTASIGAEGLPVAFLHPRSTFGVLMELIERK